MTVTLVGAWEKDWLNPKVEAFMWRQLCSAFTVDRLIMTPTLLSERTSVDQFDCMDTAIESAKGEIVLLEPKGGQPLTEFKHPQDAVYVFGNAWAGNAHRNGHKVTIVTPKPVDFFAIDAAAITLFHRGMYVN